MGGGLMQLVAYGAQDIYLTGNPQITFFKVVYRRHTNFSMEAIEQTFNGVADFGNKIVCTIARNGDLLGKMYLEVDVNKTNTIKRLGHKLIKYAEIEIGGQKIDKHYGEWLDIWSQLTLSSGHLDSTRTLVSGDAKDLSVAGTPYVPAGTGTDASGKAKMYIPLQFWFNRNPGLALPLIALQYHEVKLIVEFNKVADIGTLVAETALENVTLYCDYVFLDTDERRRFAQVSHEYLIEQVQEMGTSSFPKGKSKVNIDLAFNHPVKELLWVVQSEDTRGYNYAPSATGVKEQIIKAKVQLNGHDRFRERSGSYFRCVQPYQHHTGGELQSGTDEDGFIHTYSFALKPEEHQPSGTCNFSRIDNAVLNMELSADADKGKDVRIYAINYNVLRIMSGMGGLAYSN